MAVKRTSRPSKTAGAARSRAPKKAVAAKAGAARKTKAAVAARKKTVETVVRHEDVATLKVDAGDEAALTIVARKQPGTRSTWSRRSAVDRINAALDLQTKRMDDLALRQARPALEGRGKIVIDAASREHKSAFDAYVRSGEASALRQLETKAMSVGSNPDGGYLVPVELEREIGERLAAISPIRAISSVREISGSVYKKPFMTAGPATGWVGETDTRAQTTSPTLDALSFPVMELYAMPAATATLLDDSAVNIDEWIASEVELTFAVQEGAAFVNGDGTNKPKGFLASDTVANGSWVWGKLGTIASGAAGAFASSNPSDALVDLIYALKAGYRQNGTFVIRTCKSNRWQRTLCWALLQYPPGER
jgi:HK97 family phage major capsid protein